MADTSIGVGQFDYIRGCGRDGLIFVEFDAGNDATVSLREILDADGHADFDSRLHVSIGERLAALGHISNRLPVAIRYWAAGLFDDEGCAGTILRDGAIAHRRFGGRGRGRLFGRESGGAENSAS
jgi:hypothetical protein